MKPKQIFILVIILAAAIAAVAGYWLWQNQKQASQPFPFGGNYYKRIPDTKPTSGRTSYSQECGVCGPKGLHNVEGKACAPGLECKNSDGGVVSSVYFCVKPGESIEKCM